MSQITKQRIENNSVTIDARGPRFSAGITVVVLAAAIATHSAWLLALQAIVFAIGAFRGPQFTPYAAIFRILVRPRLKKSGTAEDVRPPQFAQSVGLVFALVALAGSLTGFSVIFTVATGAALAAAFLNAAFDYCLGCEIYLLLLRLR